MGESERLRHIPFLPEVDVCRAQPHKISGDRFEDGH
jgi:hypothetical protein